MAEVTVKGSIVLTMNFEEALVLQKLLNRLGYQGIKLHISDSWQVSMMNEIEKVLRISLESLGPCRDRPDTKKDKN